MRDILLGQSHDGIREEMIVQSSTTAGVLYIYISFLISIIIYTDTVC